MSQKYYINHPEYRQARMGLATHNFATTFLKNVPFTYCFKLRTFRVVQTLLSFSVTQISQIGGGGGRSMYRLYMYPPPPPEAGSVTCTSCCVTCIQCHVLAVHEIPPLLFHSTCHPSVHREFNLRYMSPFGTRELIPGTRAPSVHRELIPGT